jgi:hypothetical protein
MDPDVTLTILMDRRHTFGERLDAAEALLDWLRKGGFLPAHSSRNREALIAWCEGFADAAWSAAHAHEARRLRADLKDLKNTHHIVDSARRLLEVLEHE